MKAIVQDSYGSPDVLELRDIDRKAHPAHRPNLPAEQGARGHLLSAGGTSERKSRHHRMRSGRSQHKA